LKRVSLLYGGKTSQRYEILGDKLDGERYSLLKNGTRREGVGISGGKTGRWEKS